MLEAAKNPYSGKLVVDEGKICTRELHLFIPNQ